MIYRVRKVELNNGKVRYYPEYNNGPKWLAWFFIWHAIVVSYLITHCNTCEDAMKEIETDRKRRVK